MAIEGTLLILLAAVLIGLQIAIKKRLEYKQSFRDSMRAIQLPVIPLVVNGNTYWFLIDSGSDVNIIDIHFPEQLHIIGEETFTDASNTEHSGKIVEVRAEWQMIRLFTFEAVMTDMSDSLSKLSYDGHSIYGILGTNFLHKYEAIIDFKRNKLKL